MKEMRFLQAFGEIDEKYIIEAENYVPQRHNLLKYAASFAAFLFISTALIPILIGGAGADGQDMQDIEISVRYDIDNVSFVSAYSIDEIIDENPWDENAGYISLPVYKNMAYVDLSGATAYHSEDALMKVAKETAEVLGEEIEEYTYDRESDRGLLQKNEDGIYENDKAYSLDANTLNYDISVFGNGSVDINFPYSPTPVADTEDIKESIPQDGAESNDDMMSGEDLVSMYAEEYSDLIGFDDAVVSVTADYGFAGDTYYSYTAYEQGENTLQSVLNYNFSSVRFITNDEGELSRICKDDLLSSAEEVGEYLIISKEEAKEKLLDGEHIVKAPNATEYVGNNHRIKEKDIAYSTLVYSNSPVDEYFVPYYVYYVKTELMDEKKYFSDEDLKHYVLYYVPALKEDQIIYK